MLESSAPTFDIAATPAQPLAQSGLKPVRSSWLVPSLSDCFCLAILVWLFLAGASGWKALLMDADTGWHIRTGQYIIQKWTIPTHDLFSFSKPDAPWFAWEWLSDLIFGILYGWGGLKAIVLFAGILISLFSTVVLRFALWRGASVVLAFPLAMLAVGSSTVHFLARPHLFTLLLLPVALWVLEADRKRPSRTVWLLIPLTALWTNLHGGFAVFLVCLALLVVAIGIEGLLGRPQWTAARRYSILLASCGLATLINPYGYQLHVHIVQYLRSDWIRNLIQEFQAPTFRSEGQSQFELLLILGLIVAGRFLFQKRIVDALWIVFLAHSALGSLRHAPLYALVAAPFIAAEGTVLWDSALNPKKRSSVAAILWDLGRDLGPAFRRSSIWVPVAFAAVACINAPIQWPVDFPQEAFPTRIVHQNAAWLTSGRVLTTDQWGDYLIYSFYPNQRVFIDGRSDFYGEALGRDYLALLEGSHSWRSVLDRYRFDVVLIPVDWPLASLLKMSGEWRVIEDDGKAILFARTASHANLRAWEVEYQRANEKPPVSRTYTRRKKRA